MKRSPKGRLELTWMGKDSVLIPSEEGKYDYAFVDPDDPRAREVKSIEVLEQVGELGGPTGANENLLIIGDSGDALRSLATIPEYHDKYAGQVKLVYIDPPFPGQLGCCTLGCGCAPDRFLSGVEAGAIAA